MTVLNATNNDVRRVPVEPAFWLLIFGDLVAFSAMFITFMANRFKDSASVALFSESSRSLNQGIGLANTLILLTSSFFVANALSNYRKSSSGTAKKSLMGATSLGVAFISLKIYEYVQKVNEGISVTTNAFFEFYFTFTGVHLVHVIIGTGLLIYLIIRGASASAQERPALAQVEGVACYWHMVDLLWLMLFSIFYMLR